jgi:preprotein translocase subunit SecD
MQRSHIIWLVAIALLAIVVGWIDWPNNPGFHIEGAGINLDRQIAVKEGLDLQGGLSVLLEANPAQGQVVTKELMQAARDRIELRVNGLGVSEPLIQLSGANRIIVELPGIKNPDDAIKVFGETGLLQFVDAGPTSLPTGSPVPQTLPVVLTGDDVQSADVGFDQQGLPLVNFTLKGNGAKKMQDYTSTNIGKYLAVAMDHIVVESAVVQGTISSSGQISGGRMTLDDAKRIALQIRYGALPIPMKVVENHTVGPTLGADSIQRSIIAGIIGLGIVMAFMLLYYRLPGILADVALLLYASTVFAIFKFFGVVLTLAGIAGFVLSIGMAVDANILIFERLKEELRSGKSLAASVDSGFRRAWTSIKDSNVSTLITCSVLFLFGTSIIRGFALTLAIGVLVSMFTAIIVTRTLLHLVVVIPGAHGVELYGPELKKVAPRV